MRYRVTNYTIDGQNIVLPDEVTILDIRLVVNETQKKVICSSMQKDNVYVEGKAIIVLPDVCTMQSDDQLTIEIDKGDSLGNIQLPEIDTDTLAKETTLQEESTEIKNKIDNSVAKLGENTEATNTAIMLSLDTIKELIGEVTLIPNDDEVGEGNQAWTLVLNKTLSVNNGAIE